MKALYVTFLIAGAIFLGQAKEATAGTDAVAARTYYAYRWVGYWLPYVAVARRYCRGEYYGYEPYETAIAIGGIVRETSFGRHHIVSLTRNSANGQNQTCYNF